MISKELFIEIINLIRKQEEIDDKITEALPLFLDGNGLLYTGQEYHYKALMKLLKACMKDEFGYIEWWLYGEEKKEFYVDDEVMDVTTPEKLYDFLAG